MNEVTDLFVEDDSLADAGVYQITVDQTTGRIVVWMRKLTDAVAATIVAHYGTDLVAIIVTDKVVDVVVERPPAYSIRSLSPPPTSFRWRGVGE